MKYIFTFLVISLKFVGFSHTLFPINYQGVAEDCYAITLSAQDISCKSEVLQGSVLGSSIYGDPKVSVITATSVGLFARQMSKNGTVDSVNLQKDSFFYRHLRILFDGSSSVV